MVIPDSVISIGSATFMCCTNLTSITIPDSVTLIDDSAFRSCLSLTSVYYNGTAEEWANISINSSNDPLTNAIRYYYNETKPTEAGNYWHYNENSAIVVW